MVFTIVNAFHLHRHNFYPNYYLSFSPNTIDWVLFVRAGLSSWGFLPSSIERNGFLQTLFRVVQLCSLLAQTPTGAFLCPNTVTLASWLPTSSGDHDLHASSWRAACSCVWCDGKTQTETRRQKFSCYLQSSWPPTFGFVLETEGNKPGFVGHSIC